MKPEELITLKNANNAVRAVLKEMGDHHQIATNITEYVDKRLAANLNEEEKKVILSLLENAHDKSPDT